ncbi:prephenate/arogenate dehydrogenase, partial [filamentous cyanobacterium LEGE 11480]
MIHEVYARKRLTGITAKDSNMKIGIIGLGLIGGSLGLDLKAKGYEVIGVSRRNRTCKVAVERAIVDRASTDLTTLAVADVIFICTPIGQIKATVEQLVPHLRPTTILTDVGSVKAGVVETIAPLWPNFIGGHPMAGTAESGVDAALRNLFAGNPYVLTPIASTPQTAVTTMEHLINDLKANLLHCAPPDHDRAVAWISHLPVITSASLIASCLNEPDKAVIALAQALASSGFRDTSRVGGGNPELGRMMAEFNQPALLQTLYGYRTQLDQMIGQIKAGEWSALTNTLQATQTA